MIDTFKEVTRNQFEAALCMLDACVDLCPDAQWHAPVANLKFCQVAFHTLIFTDLYLGRDIDSLRSQTFHQTHSDVFAGYEELEDRVQQQVYEVSFIKAYLMHCRDKAASAIDAETVESLNQITAFDRKPFTRAELYFVTVRHLQHHSAQLSLRLRLDVSVDVPWVESGWKAAADTD